MLELRVQTRSSWSANTCPGELLKHPYIISDVIVNYFCSALLSSGNTFLVVVVSDRVWPFATLYITQAGLQFTRVFLL